MQHKPEAILAADVMGYSKLMAQDEAGTLVEFPSVVDAVEAALAIQQEHEFSPRQFVRWQGLKSRAHCDRLLNALTAAGLPE